MYGVEALLAETSHPQHEKHTIQEFLTTCPSTIKPVELQCQPQNPHLYFLLSCITQLIVCHNQSILMQIPWQLHIISSQNEEMMCK